MKFEEALKRAAEKWFTLFKLNRYGYFEWRTSTTSTMDCWSAKNPNAITQDDLDEILAMIGHYYEIITVPPDEELHLPEPCWAYIAHKRDPYCNCIHGWPPGFKTKLEAAKSAFIAVIERETK